MLPGATSRRGFFGVLAGAVAAPIVVRSGVLTPVKAPITVPAQSVPPIQIFTPRNSWLSTDGRLCAPLEWLACQRGDLVGLFNTPDSPMQMGRITSISVGADLVASISIEDARGSLPPAGQPATRASGRFAAGHEAPETDEPKKASHA